MRDCHRPGGERDTVMPIERHSTLSDETDRVDGGPGPADPVLVAHGLSKTYRMGEVDVIALHEVELALREGEFVVLLGPSGSGKSTLLNILGGLDVPSSGTLAYRDHDLGAADDACLRAPRQRTRELRLL